MHDIQYLWLDKDEYDFFVIEFIALEMVGKLKLLSLVLLQF